MTKRPGLSALSSHLTPKSEAQPIEQPSEVATPSTASKKRAGAQADGRKGVLLRLKPEAWMQLKAVAAQQTLDRQELFSMQSALEEALNDWFRKHGKPPIA